MLGAAGTTTAPAVADKARCFGGEPGAPRCTRSARRHLRSYGYLYGIGPEPEDLGDEWENMFTPTAPNSKPHKWYHDASSDSESDCSEGEPPAL